MIREDVSARKSGECCDLGAAAVGVVADKSIDNGRLSAATAGSSDFTGV